MFKNLIYTLLFCMACNTASAKNISFFDLLKGGKTFFQASGSLGGEAVIATTEGDELDAGDAFTFSIGRDLRYSDRSKRFIRFSVGYKYGFLKADNDTATLTALRVNTLYMQQTANFVYGAGLGLHINPSLEVFDTESTADNAIGLTGQAGYKISPYSEVGLTIDVADYKITGNSVSANAVGLFYTKRFGG